MTWLWAVLLPPYAVLKARGVRPAVLNVLLCGMAVVPGVLHAVVLLKRTEWERWMTDRTTGEGQ